VTSSCDVIVVGAGLAGLSCARDLEAGGATVSVLEARPRAGGRVEQVELPDGRRVQLGGEVVGNAHTSYLGLVEELGLTLTPSYVAEPGEITRQVPGSVDVGTWPSWCTDADRASYDDVEAALATVLASIDPADPWSCPDLARLDRLSVGDWLREVGATPNVQRLFELVHLSLADGSIERQSLFAYARKTVVGGTTGSYDVEQWENLRFAEGSATVALTMAAGLRDLRLSTPVRRIIVGPGTSTVTTYDGEVLRAHAVVLAVPAGPARDLEIDGVSDARLTSLRRQRHAWAAKFVAAYDEPFWRERGQDGLSESEGVLGSTWPQQHGVLSALVPPERYAAFAGSDPETRTREALAQVAELFGPAALSPLQTWTRLWGTDPWTQGYVTSWHPGDVTAVGPLHGTHEPPFYVCGSDQWVAGYMEGAVRTGRSTAAAVLAGTLSQQEEETWTSA
jgi:monoamine oxidase